MFRKHRIVKNAEIKSEPFVPEKKSELIQGLEKQYQPKFFLGSQTVNVNVSIEEKDDGVAECIAGCFKACAGAAKAAK